MLLWLPNLPSPDAPDGDGPQDNPIVRRWPVEPRTYCRVPAGPALGGRRRARDPRPRARGANCRDRCSRSTAAKVRACIRALSAFALDQHADDYEEIRPPTLVRTETMVSTGHLPKFADEAYHVERDDLWAIPTAEVPLTSMYRGDILEESDLPMRLCAVDGVLPPRGGRGGARHPGRAADARVRQGRALRVRDRRAGLRPCYEDDGRTGRDLLAGARTSSTGCSTCAPATSATRPPAPSTSRSTRREVDMWLEVSSVSWCRRLPGP